MLLPRVEVLVEVEEVVEEEQEGARALFISPCRFLKNRWFLVRRAEVSVNWVGSCWWLPANDNNGDRGECEQQCTLLIFFFFFLSSFRKICEQKDGDNGSSSSVERPASSSSGG